LLVWVVNLSLLTPSSSHSNLCCFLASHSHSQGQASRPPSAGAATPHGAAGRAPSSKYSQYSLRRAHAGAAAGAVSPTEGALSPAGSTAAPLAHSRPQSAGGQQDGEAGAQVAVQLQAEPQGRQHADDGQEPQAEQQEDVQGGEMERTAGLQQEVGEEEPQQQREEARAVMQEEEIQLQEEVDNQQQQQEEDEDAEREPSPPPAASSNAEPLDHQPQPMPYAPRALTPPAGRPPAGPRQPTPPSLQSQRRWSERDSAISLRKSRSQRQSDAGGGAGSSGGGFADAMQRAAQEMDSAARGAAPGAPGRSARPASAPSGRARHGGGGGGGDGGAASISGGGAGSAPSSRAPSTGPSGGGGGSSGAGSRSRSRASSAGGASSKGAPPAVAAVAAGPVHAAVPRSNHSLRSRTRVPPKPEAQGGSVQMQPLPRGRQPGQSAGPKGKAGAAAAPAAAKRRVAAAAAGGVDDAEMADPKCVMCGCRLM
jgi:hypothetical protein